MLKQRILTAIALIPPVILAIWFLPTVWVAAIITALMAGCAWEWALFVPLAGASRGLFTALVAGLMILLHPAVLGADWGLFALVLSLIWWGAAAIWLKLYPAGFGSGHPAAWLRASIGAVAVIGCYVAIWNLHALTLGPWWVYLLLAIVWATDTGGYFAGKRFGRRKLAEAISPNKTWEGLWGGVLVAVALSALAGHLIFQANLLAFVLLGLLVSLISVVGDLSVSMFKRQCGVKDTGHLFPGHGGALDRLDSLLAAAPVLLLASWCLESLS